LKDDDDDNNDGELSSTHSMFHH